MRAMKRLMLLSMMILTPAIASAQSETDSNIFWDVTKAVVFDPTTYAPATLSYTSMKMDWDSSQTLFRNGWVEQNHRFTVSGRPNDVPIELCRRQQEDSPHGAAASAGVDHQQCRGEHLRARACRKYPQHRKLFKVLSWVERIAFASYVSYAASANHFKQTERNRQLAIQYGYR